MTSCHQSLLSLYNKSKTIMAILNFSLNVSPIKPTISSSKFCLSEFHAHLSKFSPSNFCAMVLSYFK